MPLVYRSMTVDSDGKPVVGSTARCLGARFGDVPPADILVDRQGNVHPETGGMSVAPSWRDLQSHRIPKRLRHLAPDTCGSNADACWRMGSGAFANSPITTALNLRIENLSHGFVEPAQTMAADHFSNALADTRNHWTIDEQ